MSVRELLKTIGNAIRLVDDSVACSSAHKALTELSGYLDNPNPLAWAYPGEDGKTIILSNEEMIRFCSMAKTSRHSLRNAVPLELGAPALADTALETGEGDETSKWDDHFRKHVATYATKHPVRLVRQLASRLRLAYEAAPVTKQNDPDSSTIPALYVSKGQLEKLTDVEEPFGRYIPARKEPAGNFTTPLFQDPQTPSSSERRLRRLLAHAVNVPQMYYDDGEASGQELGIQFDFMRDSAEDLESKIRGLRISRYTESLNKEDSTK